MSEIENLIAKHRQFVIDEPRADKHSVFYAQKVSEEGQEMISHSDNGEFPDQQLLGARESADALLALIGFWSKMGIPLEVVIREANLKIDELRERYNNGYYDEPPVEEIPIYDP